MTESTFVKYPDETLPGWLRELRESGDESTARNALVYGAEHRTREIAAERLDFLEASKRGPDGRVG